MFKNTHFQGFLSPELGSIQNICTDPVQADSSLINWSPQPRKAKPKIENTKAVGWEPVTRAVVSALQNQSLGDLNSKTPKWGMPPHSPLPSAEPLERALFTRWTSHLSGKKQHITWAIMIGRLTSALIWILKVNSNKVVCIKENSSNLFY